MRYTLLLRGINVGGKNKVDMSDLKADLAELGFENLVSYINSGNLFFDSSEREGEIGERLTAYFRRSYDFPIPFVLISSAILQEEMAKLPAWWRDEAAYRRDVLFYLPEANREQIEAEAGRWANDKELLHFGQTAFFYRNSDQADYLKSNYHKKLLKSSFYKSLTIRNGKTFQKILELADAIQR
ncbi:Uncharacterised protein [Streptococcus constellatus]|uniref:Phosphopentomutase n=1 Tax=Streptococcus constellatus TaxID=76860 RepID=A0A564SCW2_STRCV|nr:DUF1697 domain-containing protein [Streptococcus constellatus]VUW92909.1 Uncharacterised protein [Streptococcus constellatus]VUX11569.1 Uncharacterised protein [Streptococcus gordonii]